MQARIAQKEETIIGILILKLSCSCAGPYCPEGDDHKNINIKIKLFLCVGPYCPEGGDDHKNINIKIKLFLCRPVLPRRRR